MKMRSKNAPVIEPQDAESVSSSSMSGYGSDVEDVELELRKDKTRRNIRPDIVIREVQETRFDFGEFYDRY